MDLITQLQEIGLTGREAEIYINLLQKKNFRAPEIAKITSISRTKIYEILQNLINKGACSERQENGKKIYSAIEPDIAINNILSIQRDELLEREKVAQIIEKKLSSFRKKNTLQNNPLDYIEILNDKNQILKKWLSIQNAAKREVLFFTKGPYTTSSFSENLNEEIEILNKGVKFKGIYESKDITNENLASVISSWARAGEEARVVEELPIKLAIFDERITMLALNDPISLKPSITTMIINHPSFATSQKYVFNSIWEKAIPLEEFIIKGKK